MEPSFPCCWHWGQEWASKKDFNCSHSHALEIISFDFTSSQALKFRQVIETFKPLALRKTKSSLI